VRRRERVAARIITPLRETATLAILGPGDTFGELALLGAELRRATVTALKPGETRSLHAIDFAAPRRRHSEATEVLLALLARTMVGLSEQVVDALYLAADRRRATPGR